MILTAAETELGLNPGQLTMWSSLTTTRCLNPNARKILNILGSEAFCKRRQKYIISNGQRLDSFGLALHPGCCVSNPRKLKKNDKNY